MGGRESGRWWCWPPPLGSGQGLSWQPSDLWFCSDCHSVSCDCSPMTTGLHTQDLPRPALPASPDFPQSTSCQSHVARSTGLGGSPGSQQWKSPSRSEYPTLNRVGLSAAMEASPRPLLAPQCLSSVENPNFSAALKGEDFSLASKS